MTDIMKRNNVKIYGQGEQTILFAHGFGCDQSMWQYIVPAFEKNYRIVLFDYVGSGNSAMEAYTSEKYTSLAGYVQDMLDVVDTLQLQNIRFVGHSISSMIGMRASIERPNTFEQLIMIGPSPCYLNDGVYKGGFDQSDVDELLMLMEMNFDGWASYLAPIAMNAPEQPALAENLEQTFKAGKPLVTREFAEATFLTDHRDQLQFSQVPTLILQCAEDSIVPLEVGEYLSNNLANSEFRLMKAKGHYPHISHPQETIGLIREFFNNGVASH